MSQKIEIDGIETEVFTAAEVEAAKTAVKGEYEPKLTAAEAEKVRLDGLLKERAEEFKGFRKLNDEQVAKLDASQRVIYENGLALEKEREINAGHAKAAKDAAIATAVRAKVGTDAKLFEEAMKMYQIITLDDTSAEGIAARATAAFGALTTSQPDLLASAGFTLGGGFAPPQEGDGEKKSFADTDAGKDFAKKMGLQTEAPKKA